MERKSIEAQINEFGQTPRQLFTSPHPSRIPPEGSTAPVSGSGSAVKLNVSIPSIPTGNESVDIPEVESLDFLAPMSENTQNWPNLESLHCTFSYKLHREFV